MEVLHLGDAQIIQNVLLMEEEVTQPQSPLLLVITLFYHMEKLSRLTDKNIKSNKVERLV